MKVSRFHAPGLRWSVLFGFSLIWGCVLWWGVAVHGLGTSRDSVEYLFTSLSLTRGDGFVSFLGQPYILWPPLYPILLALVQTAGIADPLRAALVLQLITFILLAALGAWLFRRIFQRNFALAFLANALAGTGIALTAQFQAVGSDYLFIALTLGMVYLCVAYINSARTGTLWLMVVVSALAMLQRYIGITVLLTCAWIVFHYSRTGIWEKVKRLLLLGMSVIPVGVWAFSLPAEAVLRDDPSSLFENIYWFTFSILSWFFPEAELYGHPVRLQFGMWALWLGIFFCGVIFWKFRKPQDTAMTEMPLFTFGMIYTIVLIVIASLSSFNSLDGRFASPIFIPLVTLVAGTFERILAFEFLRTKALRMAAHVFAYAAMLAAIILSGFLSVTSLNVHHRSGQGYTSLDWSENDVMDYWLAYQPAEDYLVFSNYPAGVAVQTWHVALSSPRRTAHPNAGEAVIPLDTYLPSLFAPGKESYLVWIEPNEYTHVYSVDDLRSIVKIETVYENEDGGVYRILP